MFKKILIANRGEIACRIIKTARMMGIKTVAVYSDADRNALHVSMADEAVHIGGSPAAQSYLVAEKIIAAAKQTDAGAVHPGYGFLSERASFCEALEARDIVFIGPKPVAIRAMGDKIESKKFASAAGVSIVPGFIGVISDAAHARRISDLIGYPVMIKASAGGGGKGMRIAWSSAEVEEGFERATSEALNAFSDGRVFIEKFIVEPRHIEIQILGDSHGNCIHLGERECSIQRRNQKVVEEAPSPFLNDATREAMGAQSVALARAVDYQSAGTVEFIVDKDHNFYFLEMNTRLQVEHPVTELITGIDLVEHMIRVAAGEVLAIKQSDVTLKGWAIESRIYAEDPHRNFLPSTGRLIRYTPPLEGCENGVTVRNDTGVYEGAEISIYYDPMVAKLCTHAQTRASAIEAMSVALDGFIVDGIGHNIPFLSALMRHHRWRSGNFSTAFIAQEYPDGFHAPTPDAPQMRCLAAIALSAALLSNHRLARCSTRATPRSGLFEQDWVVRIGDVNVLLRVVGQPLFCPFDMQVEFHDGKTERVVTHWLPGDGVWRGTVGSGDVTAQVRAALNGLVVAWQGVAVKIQVMSPRIAQLSTLMPVKSAPDMSKLLLCPMPGVVISLYAVAGQKVQAGDTLAVVEAMKMENVLRADRDLVVAKVYANAGDNLAVDSVIMDFEN